MAPALQGKAARSVLVRSFLDAGYALVPLNGKAPTFKNWPDTAPGDYSVDELSQGNYGVVLKAGDLVIDVDPRNFVADDKPVARLVEAVGPLLSFTVQTGGGGLHIYLTKPADVKLRSKLKEFPGIDFRSGPGSQVVGPGCIHPDTGVVYFVKSGGSPKNATAAPDKLIEMLSQEVSASSPSPAPAPKNYKDDTTTRERFLDYLRQDAPTSGSFKVACRGRDMGLPPKTTWKLMVEVWNPRRNTPKTPEEMKVKVRHAYKYAKGKAGGDHPASDFSPSAAKKDPDVGLQWITNRNGEATKCFYNLLNYLNLKRGGLYRIFGYNEFSMQIEFMSPAPWHNGRMPKNPAVTDHDIMLLKGHLAVKNSFEMPISTILEGVTNVADNNRFHPVRDYLKGLQWDGEYRLDTWLRDYCGADDTSYIQACARKTLAAAVMRVMKPGIKFDHVLVLEGEQDVGKSSICRILGGEWSADFPVDPRNKDTIQAMIGKWIIELAELEFTRRADTDAIKAFLSRSTDKVRLAYGRLATEYPRQSIFIASKNPGPDGTYLKDDTGNRRWWPVALKPKGGQIDFTGLKKARDQLFAEAMNLVSERGERLYMETKNLKAEARTEAALRYTEHPWTERIGEWLEAHETPPKFVTGRQVYIEALGGIDKSFGRRESLTIAGALRVLGWDTEIKRIGDRTVRGYAPRGNDVLKDIL